MNLEKRLLPLLQRPYRGVPPDLLQENLLPHEGTYAGYSGAIPSASPFFGLLTWVETGYAYIAVQT